MALHKSIEEVRALPYPEFRRWQIYYLLEPWGWENDEFHFAALLAMLYNINRTKGTAKEPRVFYRNMEKAILEQFRETPNIENMDSENKREFLIRLIKQDFGIK